MIENHITRRGEIDGKQIIVYDKLISSEDNVRLAEALDANAFTRNEYAKPETVQFRHWAINVTLQDTQKLPIYEPALQAAKPFCGDGSKYRIYRSYCNYASYGDMLFTHTDCLPDAKELTALWFIAKEWDVEWGGETLFFNKDMDAEFVVSPKPGRLVVFDGAITHVGKPPNRICYTPRYTFAFKLEKY
ncbi:MAG: 2OG-Fe(II) oxygenase [Gammaproteobacteria bacterium]|nr:2OG-Fe(II) oxygenase [Gammaproteobacteria bacterium]